MQDLANWDKAIATSSYKLKWISDEVEKYGFSTWSIDLTVLKGLSSKSTNYDWRISKVILEKWVNGKDSQKQM